MSQSFSAYYGQWYFKARFPKAYNSLYCPKVFGHRHSSTRIYSEASL